MRREREARKQAETLLETKSRELFERTEQLRKAGDRMRLIAFVDPITQLPNRRVLEEELRQLRAEADHFSEYFALHFVDLNDFNYVARNHGHAIGDQFLRQVGERLKAVAKDTDVVARIGGDEFAILQACFDEPSVASETAVKISHALSQPCRIGNELIFCSATCGVSVFRGTDPAAVDHCFTEAEAALTDAKITNRGSFVIYDQANRSVEHEHNASRSEIYNALNENEFELWLQPQHDLASDNLAGFEALARWRHPRRGILGPGEFVSTLDHMGLGLPFGEQVLRDAFSIARRVQRGMAQPVPIGVNIAPIQLLQANFATNVCDMLEEFGLDGSMVELEITEGSWIKESGQVCETLSQLRQHGISIAVDDFGTGFSSLSYLRTLPIDRLKIDRAFIRPLPQDVQACGIVIAVVQMARALELEVVAEGIENTEQENLLRCLGVHVGQGYLYSQPIASSALRFDTDVEAPGTCDADVSEPDDEAAIVESNSVSMRTV